MASFLNTEHRIWLSNSELGEVEKELIKAFPCRKDLAKIENHPNLLARR